MLNPLRQDWGLISNEMGPKNRKSRGQMAVA